MFSPKDSNAFLLAVFGVFHKETGLSKIYLPADCQVSPQGTVLSKIDLLVDYQLFPREQS